MISARCRSGCIPDCTLTLFSLVCGSASFYNNFLLFFTGVRSKRKKTVQVHTQISRFQVGRGSKYRFRIHLRTPLCMGRLLSYDSDPSSEQLNARGSGFWCMSMCKRFTEISWLPRCLMFVKDDKKHKWSHVSSKGIFKGFLPCLKLKYLILGLLVSIRASCT